MENTTKKPKSNTQSTGKQGGLRPATAAAAAAATNADSESDGEFAAQQLLDYERAIAALREEHAPHRPTWNRRWRLHRKYRRHGPRKPQVALMQARGGPKKTGRPPIGIPPGSEYRTGMNNKRPGFPTEMQADEAQKRQVEFAEIDVDIDIKQRTALRLAGELRAAMKDIAELKNKQREILMVTRFLGTPPFELPERQKSLTSEFKDVFSGLLWDPDTPIVSIADLDPAQRHPVTDFETSCSDEEDEGEDEDEEHELESEERPRTQCEGEGEPVHCQAPKRAKY